jgi:hypothetical protein
METQYHKMFKKTDFNREAILAVRSAIKAGLFREPVETKRIIISNLNQSLCEIYNLDQLPIEYIEGYESLGSFNGNKIVLNKTSLVTFLHEFFHYLSHATNCFPNSEENARGWSISLYYCATPKLCTAAIQKGLIVHQQTIEVEENGTNTKQ